MIPRASLSWPAPGVRVPLSARRGTGLLQPPSEMPGVQSHYLFIWGIQLGVSWMGTTKGWDRNQQQPWERAEQGEEAESQAAPLGSR